MIYDKPTEYHYLPPPGQYQQHHHQESVQQQHSPQHLPQQLLKEYGGGNTTTTTATTTTGASFLPSISHHTTPVYQHQVEASHLEQPMSSITHSNAQPYPYNYQQAQVQQQQHHSFYAPTSHGATYQYTPLPHANNSSNLPPSSVNAGANNNNTTNRRGPWSPMEDKRLLELISMYGATNWVRIANTLETRTPKQCRERYHQNLKPSLNRAPITVEEGELIEKLVAQYGKKWAEISRHLNGRSDNAIKN